MQLSDDLKELFKKYIELDTSLVSGENYLDAINLLSDYLKKIGFSCETIEIPENICGNENRYNLIAKKPFFPNLPTILFYNHIDTVPADYPDAFRFRIEDGKAYGRGACDHKGSTISVLSALSKVQESKYNLIFLATTDEETDQKEQLKYITPLLKLPKDTIVFNLDTDAGCVSAGSLGLLQFELIVKGKSVHSALSHTGINAIETSLGLMEFLQKIKKDYEATFSQYETPKTGSSKYACNKLNINMIKSGIAPNVVPDKCTMTVDCRFIPEKDVGQEKEKLFAKINNYCMGNKINYEITNIFTDEGYVTEHPLIDKLNDIYHKISGEGGKYVMMGSSPVSGWTKNLKLPHFGIGVMRVDTNIHGVNEFCYLKDIENLSLTIQEFLTRG